MRSSCWSRISGLLLLLLLLAGTVVPVAGQVPESAAAAEPEILYASLPVADMPHLPGSPAGASLLDNTTALEAAIRQRLSYRPPAGSPPPAPTAGGYVTFIVGPDGQVRQAQVFSQLGAAFDQALLAAVHQLPHFVPGRLAGKPVAVYRALNVGYQAPFQNNPAGQPLPFPGTREWPLVLQQLTRPPLLPSGQRVDEALLRRLVPLPAGAPPPEERFLFTVTAQGRVERVIFFTHAGERYERAVLQAVQALPRFEPGQLNGQPVAALLYQAITFPQNDPDPTPAVRPPADSARVYTYVEQMPALPGGSGAAQRTVPAFVQAHLTVPTEVTKGQVDGSVEVSFTVGPSGVVRQPRLERSLSPACDAAALAAVARLPRLVPGRQNGQLVTVSLRITLPFYGPRHVFRSPEVAHPATFPGASPPRGSICSSSSAPRPCWPASSCRVTCRSRLWWKPMGN